ncbi:TetR/AcrR family transcriptional regulator [Conexibacter sp. SYSU D00693]|uniref:TetR/AcrR family transcriptional regulator n=1 Tax=Conexibacter sp. SYSU D00693 TaxID=2812560 RepID=UPI00196B51C3|nr:TetR family transcriptional regulator [Conexibacter sp. SYSU D00693]
MGVLDRQPRRNDPRRDRTEEAFLTAAQELLDEGVPFAELNVSALARRADRTRTAFYAHFEDRRALLMRLVTEVEQDIRAAVGPFFDASDDDVHGALAGLLATLREHPRTLGAILEAAGYDAEVAAFWHGVVGVFVAAAQQRLVAAGYASKAARARAVALVWMTERACSQQVLHGHAGVDDDALLDALADSWRLALAAA